MKNLDEKPDMQISSLKEHAKKKGMWCGALEPIPIPDLLGLVNKDPVNKEFEIIAIPRPHTPALLKICDEIIVNACDHAKGQEKKAPKQRVKKITVNFLPTVGRVSVFNDGPGLSIEIHPEASHRLKRDVYTPEVAFGEFLSGTNIEKNLDNVKGGTNGLGAKLANIHSRIFIVETVDGISKKFYRQIFRDRMEKVGTPKIISFDDQKQCEIENPYIPIDRIKTPHTLVTFIPAYESLGYPQEAMPPVLADIEAWLRFRVHLAATYVGKTVQVTYNGVPCETSSVADMAKLLSKEEGVVITSTQIKGETEPYKLHPWNLAVSILPIGLKAGRGATPQTISIINGVISNRGAHIQYIKKILSGAVEEKLRKATKSRVSERRWTMADLLGGTRLLISGALPGADWGGQRKDELQVSNEILKKYSIAPTFLKQISTEIAERILIEHTSKKIGPKILHDKFIRAKYAGKARSKEHTVLMAAEGDSAMTLLRAGLTQTRQTFPAGGPSLDWCGIISLQGVILNATREVSQLETGSGGTILVQSEKLRNNKRLLALADAWGLQYDKKYATPTELATLNYGKLLLCVDQDLDGTGKIAGLVLAWIHVFWPELIRAGRVGRLVTPLIRAYPIRERDPARAIDFIYEEEFRRWMASSPSHAKDYTIKFYKGLAAHNDEEVKHMFSPESFRKSMYTYALDASSPHLFNVYFGPDPGLRKKALVSPIEHLDYDEALHLKNFCSIPVGRVQLDIDTKSYKNDAIKRQIPGAVDGMTPARRKILLGAILRFAGESKSKEPKVFQLGGYVADKCFYHHGDASLNSTIIGMAQAFPGARKFPYLTGVGQFGNRHGDGAGSARYVGVRLAPLVRHLFPPEDRWLLPYVFEDGQRAEPQYFVPIMPMTVLESFKIVSEGWNHQSFGRDMQDTLSILRAYLSGDPELVAISEKIHDELQLDTNLSSQTLAQINDLAQKWELRPSCQDFLGETRYHGDEEYSFGLYSWDPENDLVTISELPLGVSTQKFLEMFSPKTKKKNRKLDLIGHIDDISTSQNVHLRIKLVKGAFDIISADYGNDWVDPIEDFFSLKSSLSCHLNYYSARGGVLEFRKNYLAVLLYWAPIRRRLYHARLTREKILMELRRLEEEQILKYILELANKFSKQKCSDDFVAEKRLRELGFIRIDSTLLHKPGYTPNQELYSSITSGSGANYDYILDLKERDSIASAIDRRKARLRGLEDRLALVDSHLEEAPFAGASIWSKEIDGFLSCINFSTLS